MKHDVTFLGARPAIKITTDELANRLRVVPQTVRAGLCRKGHYLGLKPVKLPNGKLLWDSADADRLLNGNQSAHFLKAA